MGITHLPREEGLDLPGEGWICQGREEMCQERAGIAYENSRKMRVKSIYAEAPPCPCGAVSSIDKKNSWPIGQSGVNFEW